MASKIKVDQIQTADGTGTIALQNQLSGMTSASMPAGAVLQSIQNTNSTRVTSSSNTYVDTGTTATITPSSTSSKIKVTVSQMGLDKRSNNSFIAFQLLRDSTQIWLAGSQLLYNASSSVTASGQVTVVYLDSPNTTSAVTYKTQFKSDDNNAQVAVQWNNSTSVILVEEIKG